MTIPSTAERSTNAAAVRYASLLFSSAEAFRNHAISENTVSSLLDINLGDVSGIEFRHRLKQRRVSAGDLHDWKRQPTVREAAHRSGCVAYLTKPLFGGVAGRIA